MKLRFTLKRSLLFIAVLAIVMGLVTRWHVRSMQQHRALSANHTDGGIWVVEFPCGLEMDPNTSNLRVAESAGSITLIIQAWLCQVLDPYYVCNCVVVFMPEHENKDIEFVSQLKGVKWIVLASNPSTETMDRWRKRFPKSTIMTRDDWDGLDKKPNRLISQDSDG